MHENYTGWDMISPVRDAPYFELKSGTSGEIVKLSDFYGDNLLLTFFPGTWAPWCRQLLAELNQYLPYLRDQKITLVAVAAQKYRQLSSYIAENELDIEILSDPQGMICKRYGVFDANITGPMKISKPSIFIMDKKLRLISRFLGLHLTDRPHVSDIITQVNFVRRKRRNKPIYVPLSFPAIKTA